MSRKFNIKCQICGFYKTEQPRIWREIKSVPWAEIKTTTEQCRNTCLLRNGALAGWGLEDVIMIIGKNIFLSTCFFIIDYSIFTLISTGYWGILYILYVVLYNKRCMIDCSTTIVCIQ